MVKAFKTIYIKGLRELYEAGELKFPGETAKHGTSTGFNRLIKTIKKKEVVRLCKITLFRPPKGP